MNNAPTPQALELVLKHDPNNTVAFACRQCGRLYLLPPDASAKDAEVVAAEARGHCVRTCICGKTLTSCYRVRCRNCMARLRQEKERALFEKAEKLSLEAYPEGALYWGEHTGDVGEGYFSSFEALLDVCENEGWDVPKYVWACRRHDFALQADVWLLAELERQELYEEAYSDIDGQARGRLQAYLDVWTRELGLHGWRVDYTRAVLLDLEAAEGPCTH